jgi:hypothetical protein
MATVTHVDDITVTDGVENTEQVPLDATKVPFTPDDGANWADPDPTTLAEAVDSIASVTMTPFAEALIKGRAVGSGSGTADNLTPQQVRDVIAVHKDSASIVHVDTDPDAGDFTSIKAAIESFTTDYAAGIVAAADGGVVGGLPFTVFVFGAAHAIPAGNAVHIYGSSVAAYDGVYSVVSVPAANQIAVVKTYTATATASCTDAGAGEDTPAMVYVNPGVYNEDPITAYPYIDVVSSAGTLGQVTIQANDPNSDLFNSLGNVTVVGVTFSGASGIGSIGVRNAETSGPTALFVVGFQDCEIGCCTEAGAITVAINNSTVIAGPGEQLDTLYAVITGGQLYNSGLFAFAPAAVLPLYELAADNPIDKIVSVDGAGSFWFGSNISFDVGGAVADATEAVAVQASNGAKAVVLSISIINSDKAVYIPAGATTNISLQGGDLNGNTSNFDIDVAGAAINATGVNVDTRKANIAVGGELNAILYEVGVSHFDFIGEMNYYFNLTDTDKSVTFRETFYKSSSTGIHTGPTHGGIGVVTRATGLTVDVASGDGVISDPTAVTTSTLAWDAVVALALTASQTNYIYYSGSSKTVVASTSVPDPEANVRLAIAVTDGSGVVFLHDDRRVVGHVDENLQNYLEDTRKFAWKTGLAVTAGTGDPLKNITVSGGSYYRKLLEQTVPAPGTDADFHYVYNVGATEIGAAETLLNTTQYDNAGTLTAMTASYYRLDTVYITSSGDLIVILGTAEFATQTDAEDSARAPAYVAIAHTGIPLAKIVVQQGVGIDTIVDQRPDPNAANSEGGGAGGGSGNHSALTGLNNPADHTWAFLVDGTRAMGGSIDMNTNDIQDVGDVFVTGFPADPVNVRAHAARHLPGGVDGLAVAAPTTVGIANAEGVTASFSRSDHVHNHGDQGGGTLHAEVIAAGAAGFISGADKTKLDGIEASAKDDQNATEVPYTPGVGADWPDPDPTTVAGALDDLAANVSVGLVELQDVNNALTVVNATTPEVVAYVIWDQSRHSGRTAGTLVAWVTAVNKLITLEVYNETTATVIGTVTQSLTTEGPVNAAITLPTVDSDLSVRVYRDVGGGGGTAGETKGIQIEWSR